MGQTLCNACYQRYKKHGTLVPSSSQGQVGRSTEAAASEQMALQRASPNAGPTGGIQSGVQSAGSPRGLKTGGVKRGVGLAKWKEAKKGGQRPTVIVLAVCIVAVKHHH